MRPCWSCHRSGARSEFAPRTAPVCSNYSGELKFVERVESDGGDVITSGKQPSTARTAKLEAVSFEILALEQPLRFAPPMAELGTSPEGFEYWWKLLQFALPLADPNDFPPLGANSYTGAEHATVFRYISVTRDLAASTVLNSPAKVTMQLDKNGRESIVREGFPPRDSVVGFISLFRQCYSTHEEASFTNIYKLIERVNEQIGNSQKLSRRRVLKLWRFAHGQLRGWPLLELVGKELELQDKWSSRFTPHLHDLNPEQLIALFAYGDLIHWGAARNDLVAFSAGALGAARELNFLRVAVSLAHFYAGFATLASSALSDVVVG